jgi:hypothetical protein
MEQVNTKRAQSLVSLLTIIQSNGIAISYGFRAKKQQKRPKLHFQ